MQTPIAFPLVFSKYLESMDKGAMIKIPDENPIPNEKTKKKVQKLFVRLEIIKHTNIKFAVVNITFLDPNF